MAAILWGMEQVVRHQPGNGAFRPATSEVELHTPPPAIITLEGARALQVRIQRLRHQLDVEFADRLNEARGFGDIGGNDDYLQALEEQTVLVSRLLRLQRLLDSATVVEREPEGTTPLPLALRSRSRISLRGRLVSIAWSATTSRETAMQSRLAPRSDER